MQTITRLTKACSFILLYFSGFCAAAGEMGETTGSKTWRSITIATEAAYAPWNLTLPGGKIGGFEPELMADLCGRIQLQCILKAQDWDGMIPGLQVGKFDVLMDAIVITPEREKAVAFSIPYTATYDTFAATNPELVTQAGSPDVTIHLTDTEVNGLQIERLRKVLQGKTIGIQYGTAYKPFIEKYFSDIITLREYKKSAEHILDLRAGRIDFSFDDATLFQQALEQPANSSLVMVGVKVKGHGEALAFRKDTPELKAMFDRAINAALADGTVKRLSEKWFKTDITP